MSDINSLPSVTALLRRWMEYNNIKPDGVKIDIQINNVKDMQRFHLAFNREVGSFIYEPGSISYTRDPGVTRFANGVIDMSQRFKLMGFDMKVEVQPCPTCGHKP